MQDPSAVPVRGRAVSLLPLSCAVAGAWLPLVSALAARAWLDAVGVAVAGWLAGGARLLPVCAAWALMFFTLGAAGRFWIRRAQPPADVERAQILAAAVLGASVTSVWFFFDALIQAPGGTYGSVDVLLLVVVLAPHLVLLRVAGGALAGGMVGWLVLRRTGRGRK